MTAPAICVTVTGATMAEVRACRDEATEADLVEIRLDGVDRPDPAGALWNRTCPVVITCRPSWEGGRFDGSEEERRRLLEAAMAHGADYVDVERGAAFAPKLIAARGGRGIVLSEHTFGNVPHDLTARYRELRQCGAEVVKLAVEVADLYDTLPLFEIGAKGRDEASGASPHVLVAMGPAGIPSRLLGARLGNRWTYAGAAAPGQMPAPRLVSDFGFRRVRADAALFGVVGNPVLHSRSPIMHNAGFAALGLNAAYVPLQASSVEDFVRFARAMKLRGASVTAPFKVAMMDHVDEVDSVAKRVGAINTIVVRDGQWLGANTDVHGFRVPLAKRMRIEGARATVLGAGGAARAVAVALAEGGAPVTIAARDAGRARSVADLTGGEVGAFPPPGGSWDVLVNATPAGSHSHPGSPMAGAPLDGSLVFDLVYAPTETQLLADARAAGCHVIGGLEMLIAQAEEAFRLWTGQPPPAGLFESVAAAEIPGRGLQTPSQ